MTNSSRYLYSTEAVSQDRSVSVVHSDHERLQVRAPEELGGPGQGWNPEQLYAAAVATCLHQSVVVIASAADAECADCTVHATVNLKDLGAQSYDFEVTATVELPHVADAATRESLIAQAASHCPLLDQSQVTAR